MKLKQEDILKEMEIYAEGLKSNGFDELAGVLEEEMDSIKKTFIPPMIYHIADMLMINSAREFVIMMVSMEVGVEVTDRIVAELEEKKAKLGIKGSDSLH